MPAAAANGGSYSAADIEVLEGLEPVRRRPGMLSAAPTQMRCTTCLPKSSTTRWTRRSPGTPTRIEVDFSADGYVTVTDNGRGIPVEAHPKFPTRSTLESS